MKIAIISDSHGERNGMNALFEKDDFDYLFFLGDGLSDLGAYVNLDNVFAVSGNCDFFSSLPNERVFELDGVKFMITHGNKYGVKRSLDSLIKVAKTLGVKVVCFGHTHEVFMEEIDGILFLNPGSFLGLSGKSSGIMLEINKDNYSIKTFRV